MNQMKIEQLAEKYQAKADAAYRNYQETGITRYDTQRRNNEDIADLLRIAAFAEDEHSEYVAMRGQLSDFAAKSARIKHVAEYEKGKLIDELLTDIVAYAKGKGLI